jgi:hypothetical protein
LAERLILSEPHPELDNLVTTGNLAREKPAAGEISGLLASGRERLADARRVELALSSRFDLAYNAAHAFCLAALRARGYTSKNRYTVFQVVPHTLGLPPATYRVLAKAHTMRNTAEYEGHLDVDERFIRSLITATDEVEVAAARLLRSSG